MSLFMGIASRIGLLFKTTANKALDHTEDPREVLDHSCQRQVEMLAQVRRDLADVATSANDSNCSRSNWTSRDSLLRSRGDQVTPQVE